MIELDAFGETCPKPVIRAMKALAGPAAAGAVRVLVDNTTAVENLKRLAASKEGTVEVAEVEGGWAVTISGVAAEAAESPADDEAALAAAGIACPVPDEAPGAPDATPATVLIGRNVLGRGNDELGAVLMKGVLYAMAQRDEVPRKIIFFNSGAYLTSEGSASLEDIRELERRGTEILTCGTCLDYLGIREQLAVGGVTNLYFITEAMLEPGRVVTL